MCEPLSSAPRSRSASARAGQLLGVVLVGLCAGLSVPVGCGRPAEKAPIPERTTAAAVDGCSGVADGALCNDRNACTLSDHCQGGVCVGTTAPDGMSCTDDNQCTSSDMCVRGKCQGSPVLDGVLCTDGDPCTNPDTCRKGQCTSGGPVSCDDGDRCTTDQCIEGDGCRHDPILMCPDAGGAGDGGPLDADAGSPPDAPPGDTGPDSAEVEVGEAGDAAEEGPPDAAPDLPPDASPDEMGLDAGDDVQPDAGPDAADGEEPADASDAGDAEDGSTPDVVPVYQAQGGACLCSSSQGPSGSVMGLAVVFGAVLLAHRRRRGRRELGILSKRPIDRRRASSRRRRAPMSDG